MGLGRGFKVTLQTRAPEISAHVDGGLSGGSRVRRPGSEDPHRRERKFLKHVSLIALSLLAPLRRFWLGNKWILTSVSLAKKDGDPNTNARDKTLVHNNSKECYIQDFRTSGKHR